MSVSQIAEALGLFTRRGVISDGERLDYLDYWRKRTNMTDEQRCQKLEINERVLAYVVSESARLTANFARHG